MLIRRHWWHICQNVTNMALPILKIKFNTRLRSEIISSLFEMQAQEYYESIGLKVKSASNDHEPDLFFEEQQCPVEIKVTKEKKQVKWMGNNVSKRVSDFILITWNEFDDNEKLNFCVYKTFLTPDDWQKSKANYNASFLKLSDIKKIEPLIQNERFYSV